MIFRNWVLQNFPFLEDDFDALTDYELFCKMVEYMKKSLEQVEGFSEDIERFNNELEEFREYFDNIDLQEEVNNKLDEMAASGYFDDIVKLYSIPKEVFRTKLYLSKIGRLNQTNYIKNNDYYGIQGGCYIGNNEFIYAFIKNDNDGAGRIIKVDFTTGEVLDHNDIDGLYHANGCCYNNGKVYFTQSYDNNNVLKNGIVEIDASTLDLVTIHNIDFNSLDTGEVIQAIGYDSTNDKYYLITPNYFYKCDNTFKVEEVISYKLPIAKDVTRQGGTFYKDYICILVNNENAVICYNRDGSLSHIIDIGQHQGGVFFGEIQNVSVINDEMYLYSCLTHHTTSNLYIIQFFKAKLNGGGLPQVLTASHIWTNNAPYTVSVNKTSYTSLTDYNKFTSDGSYDKPFESIAEAIENLDNDRSYVIEVGDTNTYDEVLDIYNKHLIIKANNSNIGAMKVSQSKVTISNAIIKHSISRGSSIGSETYHTPLYVSTNSELWLTGAIGYDGTQCASDGMTYPVVVDGSTLHDGSSVSGTRQKFLAKYSSVSPLLNNAMVTTTNSINVKNNVTHFSLYKDNSATHTNSVLMDLTEIPLYTNAYRGFWVAVLINNVNTDYHKFDVNNVNRRIIVEDIDNNNKWVLKATYDVANNTLRISPFKYDSGTGTYSLDTTTTWLAYYQFEI